MEKKETQSYYQQYLTIVLSVLIVLTILLLIKLSSKKTIPDPVFQISYASENVLPEKPAQINPKEKKPPLVKDKEENKNTEDSLEKENLLVDLNSATKEELMELPGVGPKMAEAMLQYRQENNGFSTEKDLMNISGIGEKRFKRIEPFVKKISSNISESINAAPHSSNKKSESKKNAVIQQPGNLTGIICKNCGQRAEIHKSRVYRIKPVCTYCLKNLFGKTPTDP